MPLLRRVLPGLAGARAAHRAHHERPDPPGESVPRLPGLLHRVHVHPAARVRARPAEDLRRDPGTDLRGLRVAAGGGGAGPTTGVGPRCRCRRVRDPGAAECRRRQRSGVRAEHGGDPYALLGHWSLVAVFGAAGLFAVVAMALSAGRYSADVHGRFAGLLDLRRGTHAVGRARASPTTRAPTSCTYPEGEPSGRRRSTTSS